MTYKEIIAPKGTKYLSEIFPNGVLPKGILNKDKTGCGGTTTVLDSNYDYIIFVPSIELIKNKKNQYPNCRTNNQIYIIPVYADISDDDIRLCISDAREEGRPVKIMGTYNSVKRLLKIQELNLFGTHVLVDEFHDLMTSYSYKGDANENLLDILSNHNYVTYMSATPLEDITCPVQLKNLPCTKIVWEDEIIPVVKKIQTNKPFATLRKYLNHVSRGHALALAQCPHTGDEFPPEEYFIYINSVTQIANILEKLPWVTKEEIRVVCTDTTENRKKLGEFADCLGSISENRKFNFLTRRAFYGCDVYSERGITIVATSGYVKTSLLDVAIDLKQILGRIRNENNPFKNIVIHIFSFSPTNLENESLELNFELLKNKKKSINSSLSLMYRFNTIKEQYEDEIHLKAAYDNAGFEVEDSFIRFNLIELGKRDSTNRFEDNLKEYCELTADGKHTNDIPIYLRNFYDPFVATAVNTLGRDKLKTLSYERKKIEQELTFSEIVKQADIPIKLEKTIKVGSRYAYSEMKNFLEEIFSEAGIRKKATASYINNYYITREVNLICEDKRSKGYEIIAKK